MIEELQYFEDTKSRQLFIVLKADFRQSFPIATLFSEVHSFSVNRLYSSQVLQI